MILIDREITTRVNESELIDSFDPKCLTNIGYDLRAKYFVIGNEKKESAALKPGESAFVASVETVKVSEDLLCRVVLKNSRIRQGFAIDSPIYQPGHHTRIFFRLTNVSGDELLLYKGDKYATIIFEELSDKPDVPYEGSFSDEFDFSGLGDYREIYKNQIREIENKTEDLKSVERTIYANVLVILTVFVALFSFLTTNLSLFSSNTTVQQFFIYNFVMLGCISFLVALLNSVISRNLKARKHLLLWIPPILCFLIAFIISLL